MLVWGTNALHRGLWQDDVVELGKAFTRSARSDFIRAQFEPDGAPLRLLAILPSTLAHLTPHPIWALHLLCASVWLAQGLLAGWLIGLLLPGRRWTRFIVVCLTLTATSDYTTGSIIALAYNVAALGLLAAVGWAIVWLDRGRMSALFASSAALSCSLLTMEVGLPAVPLLAVLFVWIARPHRRRLTALLVAWSVVLVPIAIVEWSFLRDPGSYAARALLPLSIDARLSRTLSLWLINFTPWRWAFARPVWYAQPAAVISTAWMMMGSLGAAGLVLVRGNRKHDDAAGDHGRRLVALAALFAAMALTTNAAYASVQLSDVHYRTHILSRVWASMAVGAMSGWALTRLPRRRWATLGVVSVFIFFGTWGGFERQDFLLGTWQRHQRELVSILTAAPSLQTGTTVILRGSSRAGRLRATEAGYLAGQWLRLLYDAPTLSSGTIDPHRGSGCTPTATGVDCWREGEAACFADGTCAATHFRFEDIVVMDYDSAAETYALVRSLRDDPLGRGFERETERYRPEDRIIIARPWTLRQRRLLLIDETPATSSPR